MEKNNIIKMNIKDLLVLCYTLDEYENFNKNLFIFLKRKKAKLNLIWRIGRIANGDDWFANEKELTFYQQNKFVIDTINNYCGFQIYICQNYKIYSDQDMVEYKNKEMYEYLLENRNKLNKIIQVLEKLNKLGFGDIEFNKDLDFSNQTYTLDLFLHHNYHITYLDNLEAIPRYQRDIVKYKSNGSNYKITLGTLSGEKFNIYDMKIMLNDLTFDSDRLPNAISKEEITDKIIALQNSKKEEYTIIRNSVDLSIGVDELFLTFQKFNAIINNLDNISKKDELITLLANIKNDILKIKDLSSEYDKEAVSDNITEELLSKEKQAYQRRREISKTHLD